MRAPLGARGLTALAACYAVLAAMVTWPLVGHLQDRIAQGTDTNGTVTFASAWALWWTAEAIGTGLLQLGAFDLWNAPIFHPVAHAFALSEPMVLLGLLAAPLIWLGASAALATNLILLTALVTNGLAGYALMRTLGTGRAVGAVTGAMVLTLPFTHLELGVLTLVPLAPVLLTIHWLVAWSREPTWRRAVALGLSFGAAYLVCAQLALLAALSIAPAALWLARRELLRPTAVAQIAAAAVVAGVLIAPVATAQLQASDDHRLERTPERSMKGSASPRAWARTPWAQLVPTPIVGPARRSGHRSLFPGTLKLLFAVIGAVAWLRLRGRRRLAALLLTLGGLGLWWSSGAYVGVGDWRPFEVLRQHVVGLAQIRSFWRAAVFTQLATVLLAGVGLSALLRSRWIQSLPPRRATTMVLVLGLVLALEIFPRGQHLTPLPERAKWADTMAWIQANTAPDEPLAFAPVPDGKDSRHFARAARWMYLQTWHGRPMINGYSSFFPRKYRAVAKALGGFPDPRSHAELRGVGVRHVVASDAWLARRLARRDRPVDPVRFAERFHDAGAGVRVFEVLALP